MGVSQKNKKSKTVPGRSVKDGKSARANRRELGAWDSKVENVRSRAKRAGKDVDLMAVGKAGRGGVVGALLACLLYTSPSPRDLGQSRMPSSA